MPVRKRIMAVQNIEEKFRAKSRKVGSVHNSSSNRVSNGQQSPKISPLKRIGLEKFEKEQMIATHSKELIKIIVCRQDHTKMVAFIMKKDERMQKLFERYASLVGVQASCLRFLLDGYRVNAMDTPRDLNIENDDVMEAYKLVLDGEKRYFKLLSSK